MERNIDRSIIRGGWQLMPGHTLGRDGGDELAPILDAIDEGFRTFDCADIYGGVEEAFGRASERAKADGIPIRVHTKFVPDRDRLGSIGQPYTQEIIDRSLRRLRTDRLDLVQFHWWDYAVPRYLEVLEYLFRLRRAGKIKAIGLTNCDGEHLREILDAGFDIASLQVQYSIIDRRCEATVLPLCAAKGIAVFTYGAILGGLLNEKWLNRPEPRMADLENRSLIKYKLIIDDWGGWARFQSLLGQLDAIARGRRCTISQVAIGSLLCATNIDAVIVGLSPRSYHAQNAELANLVRLDEEELRLAWSWECPLQGDVYHLERTSEKHSGIMRYNLNQAQ